MDASDFLPRPERRDWRNDLCLCRLFSMKTCSMISSIRSGMTLHWNVLMNREARDTFGKRGANMMKTDVKQTDNGYEVAD